MRGDSSTKSFQHQSGQPQRWWAGSRMAAPLAALGIGALLWSCEPGPPGGSSSGTQQSYTSRTAVRWTVNGNPLTAATCQSLHISSMRVDIGAFPDGSQSAEFINVTCGLDRYSMDLLPTGKVRIFVDALSESASGSCIRFSGQVDTTTTDQFPTTPAQVPLHLVSNCP